MTNLESLSMEYLKSYLSINTYIGCTVDCAYCFLAPIKIVPMRPIKIIDEAELAKRTIESKYFKEGVTVLSINNRTDPFVATEVKQSTFKLIEELDKLKIRNIVTITTKGLLTKQDAMRLNNYKNLKIVIIVTFNGLPLNIQPISREIQIQTMKNVSKYSNILLLQQFRPIISGLNDDYETIKEILKISSKYCNATIYQGIRVNEKIKERLLERNYEYKGVFSNHKQRDENVDKIFEKVLSEEALEDYKIFDHTSCCLSWLFNEQDYNMHYTKLICKKSCPNYVICHEPETNCDYDILQELTKIGINSSWDIQENKLHIFGNMNDEQRSYIRHVLHLEVTSDGREQTYSEKIIEGE